MEIHEHGVNIHKLLVNGICKVTVNSHNSGSEFWNVTGWYTRCQIILDDNYIIYYNHTPLIAILSTFALVLLSRPKEKKVSHNKKLFTEKIIIILTI